MKRLIVVILCILGFSSGVFAQDEPVIFFEEIEPSVVTARRSHKQRMPRPQGNSDWRKHYKLVYYFNAVYPYALVGRDMMAQVDSTIEAGGLVRSERNRYINDVERELFRLFEDDIRHMTINQGFLLTRLVDRECGMSAFKIIETYEGTFAANFWAIVGKVFAQDIRAKYDPEGKDKLTEELVRAWDAGRFDEIYYSVFWEDPVHVYIPTRRLSTTPRPKQRKE